MGPDGEQESVGFSDSTCFTGADTASQHAKHCPLPPSRYPSSQYQRAARTLQAVEVMLNCLHRTAALAGAASEVGRSEAREVDKTTALEFGNKASVPPPHGGIERRR